MSMADDRVNAKAATCPSCGYRNTRTLGVHRRHGGRVTQIKKKCVRRGCGTEFIVETQRPILKRRI